MVEDVEVVVINVVPSKDIGEEFHSRRLSNAGLSKKKDGVRRLCLVFRGLDDPLLERRQVAKESGQYYRIKVNFVGYLMVGVSSSLSSSSMALVELWLEGTSSLDRPCWSVVTRGSEFYGKTHSLPTEVGIGGVQGTLPVGGAVATRIPNERHRKPNEFTSIKSFRTYGCGHTAGGEANPPSIASAQFPLSAW